MKDLLNKTKRKWCKAKKATHKGVETFFNLVCNFYEGKIIEGSMLPHQYKNFLEISNGAELFKDSDYGQWGLIIYAFEEVFQKNLEIKSYRDDILPTDFIIGEFLGDSDLLIITNESNSNQKIVICKPIDKREDWNFLNINFNDFITEFIKKEGDKFWEN